MAGAKEQWEDAQLKDPEKWITRKCAVCGEPVHLNKVLDAQRANPGNPFTCNKCLNKD